MKGGHPSKFDPFSSRQARDIRNSLSKSFLQALSEKDPGLYRKKADKYLTQNLEHHFQGYVTERRREYDAVYDCIIRKGADEKIEQAGLLWDHGLYFEMHELLEKVWATAEGVRRKGLQALIRAAGMKIHAENNNLKAAASMGQKARADLELCGNSLSDFAGLETVSAEIDRTLADITDV
jgi:hypothetical protein